MEKAKKTNWILILLISLIVMALIMTAGLYYMFSSEGGQCMTNPTEYAEDKINKKYEDHENVWAECECFNALNSFGGRIDFGEEFDLIFEELNNTN